MRTRPLIAAAAVGLLCAGCASAAPASHPAVRTSAAVSTPVSTPPPAVPVSLPAYHRPTGPGDAAAEAVTGFMNDKGSLSGPLSCVDQLSYGARPAIFSSDGSTDRPGPFVYRVKSVVTSGPHEWSAVVTTGDPTWDFVASVSRVEEPLFGNALVPHHLGRYEVCRMEQVH